MLAWRTLFLSLLLLCALASVCNAATATSFCKCTCGSNSTIIPLDGESSSGTSPAPPASPTTPAGGGGGGDRDKVIRAHGTCADCSKRFCLDYDLPICRDVRDDEVFTTCFQRDSAKDQAVVYIFILATVGLLVWAAIRPYIRQWREKARRQQTYTPVSAAPAEES